MIRVERRESVPIPDLGTAELSLEVTERRPLKALRVHVDIEHPFRGDLVVTLIAPNGQSIVLHNRQGGGLDHLKQTFDALNAPALSALKGLLPAGRWTLRVEDAARRDVGHIRGFGLERTPSPRKSKGAQVFAPVPLLPSSGVFSARAT